MAIKVSEDLDVLLRFSHYSCAFCSRFCKKIMPVSKTKRRRCRSSKRWHSLFPDARVWKKALLLLYSFSKLFRTPSPRSWAPAHLPHADDLNPFLKSQASAVIHHLLPGECACNTSNGMVRIKMYTAQYTKNWWICLQMERMLLLLERMTSDLFLYLMHAKPSNVNMSLRIKVLLL